MVYIPSDWIVNKENEDKIHKLIDSLSDDLKLEGKDKEEDVIKELEELGEIKIIQKLKSNAFNLGA